jgi:hypothetical protein
MATNVEFETTLHMAAPIRLNCSRMHTFAHDCSHDDGGCSTRAATRTSVIFMFVAIAKNTLVLVQMIFLV